MKIPPLLLLVVTGTVSFGAGIGVMQWRQRSTAASSSSWSDGPRPPQLKAAAASALPADATQAKADFLAALGSPKDLSRLLRGVSSIGERSRLNSIIAGLSLDEVQGMSQQMAKANFGSDPAQWTVVSAIFERWAELDPEDLYQAIVKGELNEQHSHFAVTMSLRALARMDPEQAWQRAMAGGPHAHSAKEAVIGVLGEADPARALTLAQEDASTRRHFSWSIGASMRSWFDRDPQAALQAMESLPHGDFRGHIVNQFATSYATSDPEAALAWSQGLKNSAERQQALSQVLTSLAADDPQRVLALAEQPEFAASRTQAVTAAVKSWARKDFDGALAYALGAQRSNDQIAMLRELGQNATVAQQQRLLEAAENLPPAAAKAVYQAAINMNSLNSTSRPLEIIDKIESPGLREQVLQQAVSNSWGLSPEVARELFARLQPSSQQAHQAAHVASRLAQSDPQGALAWVEGLETPDARKQALASVLNTWAHQDPAAAARHLSTMSDPKQREEQVRNVAGAWVHQNDTAALAWAESLAPQERAAALGTIVQRLAATDSGQAQEIYARFAAGLDAESAGSQQNKHVARTLASSLAENDPRQAIVWAQALGSGPAQQEAWTGITDKWAGYDAHATSQWIATLPSGEGRDAAADRLVTAIVRDDPDSAWAWALSIGNQDLRRAAAARAIDAWRAFGDKDTALRALQNSGLDATVVHDFTQRLQQRSE